jgi:hypothetical protein
LSCVTRGRSSRPTSTRPYVPFPAHDRPELRLAVAGDVGDSGTRLAATANAMARLAVDDPYDELLLLGDNVYPSGDPARPPVERLSRVACTARGDLRGSCHG